MSVGLRRNLLCFATGALIALAVVLVVREGRDGTPEAGATRTPARVATTETTAARAPRSVRLRTKHVSPGRGRKAGTAGGGGTSSSSSSSAHDGAGAGAGGGSARDTSPTAGSTPRARPSRTTPERAPAATEPPPAADPTSSDPGGSDQAGGDGGQATDAPAPSQDAGTTPDTAGSGVTIPNPATPDASVGG